MLVVHVHVRIRPGQVGEFLAATLTNARASLGEPGDGDASAAHKLTPPDDANWASSAP